MDKQQLQAALTTAGRVLTSTLDLDAVLEELIFEIKTLFEQMQSGREQLRRLAQQVLSTQEEERQRLSRELHDEAGQVLTALKIGLTLIRDDLPEFLRNN